MCPASKDTWTAARRGATAEARSATKNVLKAAVAGTLRARWNALIPLGRLPWATVFVARKHARTIGQNTATKENALRPLRAPTPTAQLRFNNILKRFHRLQPLQRAPARARLAPTVNFATVEFAKMTGRVPTKTAPLPPKQIASAARRNAKQDSFVTVKTATTWHSVRVSDS